jgi:hypothetical protein
MRSEHTIVKSLPEPTRVKSPEQLLMRSVQTLVKSPPEPTRVKSPEQLLMRLVHPLVKSPPEQPKFSRLRNSCSLRPVKGKSQSSKC